MAITITYTVKSSGGDYTTLESCLASEQRDLVVGDEIVIIECYTMTDTSIPVVSGWTTSSTNYVKITTPLSERHNGKWNSLKYNLESAATIVLDVSQEYTQVEGLQVKGLTSSTSFRCIFANATGVEVSKCLITSFSGNFYRGFEVGIGAVQVKLWNNILFGIYIGLYTPENTSETFFYNNTIYKAVGVGVLSSTTTTTVKNTISPSYSGSYNVSSTNNASIAGGAPGSNPVNNVLPYFTGGFQLANIDISVKDLGADLSADLNLAFSDDVVGSIRSGTWDIGASEAIGVIPPTEIIKTIKPSGGDYTSLFEFSAGEADDLIFRDVTIVAECYSMIDNIASVDFVSWVTTPVHNIQLRVAAGEQHNGVWDVSKYIFSPTANSGSYLLDFTGQSVKLEGFQITDGVNTAGTWGILLEGPNNEVKDCIIKRIDDTLQCGSGIAVGNLAINARIINNIIYNWKITSFFVAGGIYVYGNGDSLAVYNNTFVNNDRTMDGATTLGLLKNNISQSNTLGYNKPVKVGSTNNHWDSGTALGSNPITGTVQFVNEAGEDFRILPADIVAQSTGVDLSSDLVFPFSTDIQGENRTGTWDLGADQIVIPIPIVVIKTVKPSGGDYSSLSGWEAGEQRDLVATNEVAVAECYSMNDTLDTVFSGWITNATHYVKITTPLSERHNGIWDDTKYRITTANANNIEVLVPNIRFEGLQISNTKLAGGFPSNIKFNNNQAGEDTRISKCILKCVSASAINIYVNITPTISTWKIWNNVIYGGHYTGLFIRGFGVIYNNTVHDCGNGIWGITVPVLIKNNVVQNCVTPYTGSFDAQSTNNISSESITTGVPGLNPIEGSVQFTTGLQLTTTDTVAAGAGVDLSADANLAFTDDLVGTLRTTWSIGANDPIPFVTPTENIKTVKPSGGDYTSLSSWEAGEQRDLILPNEIAVAECYAMEDSQSLTIANWISSRDQFIHVRTPLTNRHKGVWDNTKYRLVNPVSASASADFQIVIAQKDVWLEGLQFKNRSTSTGLTSSVSTVSPAGGRVRVSSCIFEGVATDYVAIWIKAGSGSNVNPSDSVSIWNNVAYDCTNTAFLLVGVGYLYQNTIYNCSTGIRDGSINKVTAKNNIVQACTNGYLGGFTATSTNNLSDTGITPGLNPITSTLTFQDIASKDFHLAVSDTAAIGTGVDLAADLLLPVTKDVDNELRIIGQYDVGFDQTPAGIIVKTIKPVGGDYSSLFGWEAGEQKDLVASNEVAVAECYAMQDTSEVKFAGWTTDTTRFVHIVVPPTERHSGRYDETKYVLLGQGGGTDKVLDISEIGDIKIEGIQLGASVPYTYGIYTKGVASGVHEISKSIIKVNPAITYGIYIDNAPAGTIYKIYNTLFQGNGTSTEGIRIWNSGLSQMYVYNNTFWRLNYGVRFTAGAGQDAISYSLKNNLFYRNANDTNFDVAFDLGSTNNFTTKSSTSNIPGVGKISGQKVEFTDGARLATFDTTGAIAGGVDLSLDPFIPFIDDMNGVSRVGVWSVGAAEATVDVAPTLIIKTIKPVGGDYTSLTTWVLGEERDLVINNEQQVAECYSMTDTDFAFASSNIWNTSIFQSIKITAPLSERHTGKLDFTKFIISGTANIVVDLRYVDNVELEGIQITSPSGASWLMYVEGVNYNTFSVSKCIFDIQPHVSAALFHNRSDLTSRIWNTIFQGTGSSNSGTRYEVRFNPNTQMYLSNNTFYRLGIGIHISKFTFAGAGVITGSVRNNLFTNCVTDFYRSSITDLGSGNNVSSNTVSLPGINNLVNTNITFTDGLRPTTLDTVTNQAGLDLSTGFEISFTDDLNGIVRGVNWSAGALEDTVDIAPTVVIETLGPVGKDFTSIEAWAAGTESDLILTNRITQLECYAMEDTVTSFDISLETSSIQKLKIGVPLSERHNGIWDDTKYRITGSSTYLMTINTMYAEIQGIQMYDNAVGSTTAGIYSPANTELILDEIIFRGTDNLSHGISTGKTLKVAVRNCLFNGLNTAIYSLNGGSSLIYAYNNTFYGNVKAIDLAKQGVQPAANSVAINNLAQNHSGIAFGGTGTFIAPSATNCSDEGSGLTIGGFVGSPAFINIAGEDFHLDTADVIVRNLGTDLSAITDYPFTTDVDQRVRSDGNWDISFDEILVEILDLSPLPSGNVGSLYTHTMSADYGLIPYVWSLIGALPSGFSLNTSTGEISGIPVLEEAPVFQIAVTDSTGTIDIETFALQINATLGLIVITTNEFPDAEVSQAYSFQAIAGNGIEPYVWSLDSGSLPLSFSLDPNTGVVSSASATNIGLFSFVLRVVDFVGTVQTKSFSIDVQSALEITSTSPLPNATENRVFSQILTKFGGVAPSFWFPTPIAGGLPPGLKVGSSGILFGTPTTYGNFNFTLQVSDSYFLGAVLNNQVFDIFVIPDLVFVTETLENGDRNTTYSETVTIAGGFGAYSWLIISGALPSGLVLDQFGVISGTPIIDGTFNFTLQVSDSNTPSNTITQSFSITVVTLNLIFDILTLLGGQVSVPYDVSIEVSGGLEPYTWSLISGTLPSGLVLGTTSGVISGIPTDEASEDFTIRVVDSDSTLSVITREFQVNITTAESITATGVISLNERSIYKDLNQFQPKSKHTFSGSDAILQSVHNLILTKKFERIFNPTYGSILEELLFEPMDETTELTILAEIITAIESWEPRVSLLFSQSIVEANYDENKYDITLKFKVKGMEEKVFEYKGELNRS